MDNKEEETQHELNQKPKNSDPQHELNQKGKNSDPQHELNQKRKNSDPQHELNQKPKNSDPQHELNQKRKNSDPQHELNQKPKNSDPQHELNQKRKNSDPQHELNQKPKNSDPQHELNQKGKNSDPQHELNQKRKNSDLSGSGKSSSTRFSSEEEEDMLELRLNSQRSSRPRPNVQPQRSIVPPELNQLSITNSHPQTLNPPSNHVQVTNTHLFYPLNNLHGSNRPACNAPPPPPPLPPSPPPPPQVVFHQDVRARPVQNPPPEGIRPRAPRRNSNQAPGQGKSETVPAPFPWATTRRATVYSLSYLMEHNIVTISGEVQCKRCEKKYEIEYNLMEKYTEVGRYIIENRSTMHDRAPAAWKDPVLPTCKLCGQENSAKPVVAEKKKEINWLFLFLGQMLGCCTLDQLKYFCKHTKNHRTGAKDRVLYLTYLCLCKQLNPACPFDPKRS